MKPHFVFLTLALFATNAQAQSVDAGRPDSVAHALQDLGYRAELTVDSAGDPLVNSAANGVNYAIYFYGCTDGIECQDLQFVAGFDVAEPLELGLVNSWNRDKVVGRASLDEEGDPFYEMFIPGAFDLPRRSFERILQRWENGMGDFLVHIDW